MQLICVFVFAYAKSRVSHNESDLMTFTLYGNIEIYRCIRFLIFAVKPLTIHQDKSTVKITYHGNRYKGFFVVWGEAICPS